MRNNSQNAGCILRLPVSHSCQPRIVQWMSAAAAVCESPTASRAARTCSGRGFAAGHFRPRFGWLGIFALSAERQFNLGTPLFRRDVPFGAVGGVGIAGKRLLKFGDGVLVETSGGECIFVDDGHFQLLPLFPRRCGLRCATHDQGGGFLRKIGYLKSSYAELSPLMKSSSQ